MPKSRLTFYRVAAAVLAVLLITASAGMIPRVRAGVAGWAKEIWGTESVLYRFFGQAEEPAAEPGEQCTRPYECWYRAYCGGEKDLPENPADEQIRIKTDE